MFFILSKKLFSFSRHSNFCNFLPFFPHFPDSKGQIRSPLTPSFWLPPNPSKCKIVQSPPFCSNPLLMRKVLVSPPPLFFAKSCFMKPIIRCHESIVFHQDLTATGSSNKKMLVFFHFTSPHNTRGQVLSGGTQQFIENAFYGMYHYRISIKK